ncbi:MAG: sodium/solute symporter [Planctomycetia bacterium]|nr:sodium/solute symporter [Planctomycetia bacterium]
MASFLLAQASDSVNTFGNMADVLVFFLFLAIVILVAFGMSRDSGKDSESYFLAGRGLKWWLIGFSLIAANISAEQFVGMSGNGADYIGLAVASYEWIAAISLVLVAFFFLPRFLRAGIYTIPQYLETRYNKAARTIMSILMMIMLVAVNITVVTYAGAKAYAVFFQGVTVHGIELNLQFFCWVIGVFAALYIFAGGLKACAWADLLQGSALIVAGGVVLYFAMKKLGVEDPSLLAVNIASENTREFTEAVEKLASAGAWERFNILNVSKLRMNLPSWDLVLPVTALIVGIWIPNLYYWGLNQYIIQRTLGAKSLGEGQKGLVFAAFMKLLIPFIVIFPGMIAFNLYSDHMNQSALKDSQKEIERLEAAITSGETPETLFCFSRSYAKFAPEKAEQIVRLNAQIADVEVPDLGKEGMDVADEWLLTQNQVRKLAEAKKFKFSEKTINGYDSDSALPLLMTHVIPKGGFKGFMLAALLGAIISSVAAMLNAASTIFTMDIFNEYALGKSQMSEVKRQKLLVFIGRVAVVVFVLIGCIVAPIWANPKYRGVFTAIQEFQGYISPGIFAAFVVGFWMKKAPKSYGVVALLGCPILYYLLARFVPSLDFLNRMAVVFAILILVAFIMRIVRPRSDEEANRSETLEYPSEEALATEMKAKLAADGLTEEARQEIEASYAHKMTSQKWEAFLKGSKGAKIFGVVIIIVTILLYLKYWDYDLRLF